MHFPLTLLNCLFDRPIESQKSDQMQRYLLAVDPTCICDPNPGGLGQRFDHRLFPHLKHTELRAPSERQYTLITSIDPKSNPGLTAVIEQIQHRKFEPWEFGRECSLILGKGGFGTVRFAAFNGFLCAIKKVDEEAGAREIQAQQLLRKLKPTKDTKLATTLDVFKAPGKSKKPKTYITQELMRDGSLGSDSSGWGSFKREFTSLSKKNKLMLALTLTAPVIELHESGLAHRDIKPENYLKNGTRITLGDFGLLTDEHISTRRAGTLLFMPPESFNPPVHPMKCDCFALGATLFNLVTGHHATLHYRVEDNAKLSKSPRFLAAVSKAIDTNTRRPTLKTVALHLMHPNHNKRLDASQAKSLLDKALAVI